MTRPCTVFLFVSCTACLAAPVGAQDAPVPAQAAERRDSSRSGYAADVVKRGRDQFVKTCSFCHGANATGTSNGPNLILSTVVRHDDNGSQIGPVIREGRPDKGMPAFNLTDTEIADLATFLHSRMAASDLRSATHSMSGYSLDKLLTGKPEDGKTFFFGAGKCFTCHSPTGDLAGIAGKYPPVTLQARMLYPAGSREAGSHETATVTDASGRQSKGPLVLLTNFDVAIHDTDGWYRSWPLESVTVHIEDPLGAHLALLPKYTDADMHSVFAYLESLK
jgi:cytochrome c oxidase cbb3-type subunit III